MFKKAFHQGLKHGIPIGLGYFAVAFALGISAKQVGLSVIQAMMMSMGMIASAGEFAALSLINEKAAVIEMIVTTLIVNMRYFLMSSSMTQKLSPKTSFGHRFFLAYSITDEIFALSVTVPGYLNPYYTYGITLVSSLGWTTGTGLGLVTSNLIPEPIALSLSVAIYGMFLAIIIPEGKKDHFIAKLIFISMLASGLFSITPVLRQVPSGYRIIILTILIASLAAWIRPMDFSEDALQDAPEEEDVRILQE